MVPGLEGVLIMSLEQSPLTIDVNRTVCSIERYVRDVVDENQARGVLVGLSGGVDSVVLSALAVRALSTDCVHVVYIYDRDNEKASAHRARLAADWLGLELKVQNIEPAMRERGIYAPLSMRLCSLSGILNRLLLRCYELIFAESPWISVLRQGRFDGHGFKEWVFDSGIRHVEVAFNVRHIYRREILEEMAKEHDLLLLGAANRSEYAVGWFVSGGIDDLPFSPLKGLYKTQIRQLATYLGIPSEIQNQKPSPDMIKGITDESALGLSYATIDIVLDGIDRTLADKEMILAGVTREEISHVREMNRLSTWKRPVDRVKEERTGSGEAL